MFFDLERIRANVQKADTEDLLDRATVYRPEMEEAALGCIDEELRRRGITSDEIRQHEQARNRSILREAGRPVRCSLCHRPAVIEQVTADARPELLRHAKGGHQLSSPKRADTLRQKVTRLSPTRGSGFGCQAYVW